MLKKIHSTLSQFDLKFSFIFHFSWLHCQFFFLREEKTSPIHFIAFTIEIFTILSSLCCDAAISVEQWESFEKGEKRCDPDEMCMQTFFPLENWSSCFRVNNSISPLQLAVTHVCHEYMQSQVEKWLNNKNTHVDTSFSNYNLSHFLLNISAVSNIKDVEEYNFPMNKEKAQKKSKFELRSVRKKAGRYQDSKLSRGGVEGDRNKLTRSNEKT